MTKTELIDALSEKNDLTKKDTAKVVDNLFDTISEFLAEEAKKKAKDREKVKIIGFGSFEARDRSERKGRNPQTGEEIKIPSRVVPVFKAGKTFKDKVDGKK